MYKIRKEKVWPGFQFSWKILFFLIFFTILWIIAFIDTVSEFKKWWEINTDILWALFIILIPVSILLFLSIKASKVYLSKNLQKNWKWIIKKIKISAIEEINRRSKWIRANQETFSWYYLQAEDWDIIYCSDGIEKDDVQEVLIFPDVSKIYRDFWYEYDKNETHKKEVLKEIDKDMTELEHKINNWWFLKKRSAKKELSNLKEDKKLVEMWYQPSYIVVNWRKVSVWNTVDVYIDPDDEKNYRMDIDFLFNK
jgi:hypothetical protein